MDVISRVVKYATSAKKKKNVPSKISNLNQHLLKYTSATKSDTFKQGRGVSFSAWTSINLDSSTQRIKVFPAMLFKYYIKMKLVVALSIILVFLLVSLIYEGIC